MKNPIAYCGLNCEKCDVYQATVHNDEALRVKTAALWSKMNNTEIKPEMLHCLGCREEGMKTYFCECICAIRRCAREKSVSTCAGCGEMATCKTVGALLENSKEARENLESLK